MRGNRLFVPLAAYVLLTTLGSTARADFLYVNNNMSGANSVSVLEIDALTGALTQIAGSPFATGGVGWFNQNNDSLTFCGGYLYATNSRFDDNTVSGFSITGGSGVPVPVAGSPFATGNTPNGTACSADGDRLYVANYAADSISIFDINAATGALSLNAASPYALVPGSESPYDLEIDASGLLLFVTNNHTSNVDVYDIAPDGSLSPVVGSPFTPVNIPHDAVLTPDGAFYYVADNDWRLRGFSVAGSGALTPLANSPYWIEPMNVEIDDAGTRLFAADHSDDLIHVLDIDAVTGDLTPALHSPFPTDTNLPGSMLASDGFLYVVNGGPLGLSTTISVYKIDPSDGGLTPVPGSPFFRGIFSMGGGLAIGPSGLDHFLCYKEKAPKFSTTVSLADQFDTGSHLVKKGDLLCTPADKNSEGTLDEETHLESFKIAGPHEKLSGVMAVNQFGALRYDTKKASHLMVPTSKFVTVQPPSRTADGRATPDPPDPNSNVDHYRCVKAKVDKDGPDFVKGGTATVVDQFATRQVEIKKPSKLCVPTDKNGEGIKDPDQHLVCYKVKPDSKTSQDGLLITNQFRTEAEVEVKKEKELCVPSLKSVSCGNDTIDSAAEQCDGVDLGGLNCGFFGFSGGSLVCDSTCQIDTSGCSVCGNNTQDAGEECDGTDDANCPGLCTIECQCLSGREDVTPCSPSVTDTWSFNVTAGQQIVARVDTENVATAAGLWFGGECGSSAETFFSSDHFSCTFPPPFGYGDCAEETHNTAITGTCTLDVASTGLCANNGTGDYGLRVTVDGTLVFPTLTGDDQP